MRLIGLADDFSHWLLSEDNKPESIRNHMFHFKEFCSFTEACGVAPQNLRVDVARDYLVWLTDRPNRHTGKPLSSATRLKHYGTLRLLSNFLMERKLLAASLLEGIKRPSRKKTVIQGFSVAQLQAIIDAIRNVRSAPEYKDRMSLLVYTLASTGLRISEALNLRGHDMDHNKRIMIVLGKGNKEREVPLSRDLSMLVLQYTRKYDIDREEFIFASRYGRPLQHSSVRDALRKAGKSLGTHLDIDQMRVSPHTLRHTFARLWVIKGGNTIALSRIMGHSSTQMTSEYVRLWGVDLNTSYDLCDPCGDISVPKFD
ncbi:tyrosine-type recombinase/integrase [Paenibacillus sp. GCM10012307]|uniref:Tyrosine-type recombinase/integrase n=1 Tax=Paenibacillus roseus TaxID=2798579 RepID=A0A934J5S6_9BACL|nr:tyrosine-type recombinase/integrase [Paenibacillus roseus]MBJ6360892.1 tyrosine-type recombinase/integrase [Paenibacillus roseus]